MLPQNSLEFRDGRHLFCSVSSLHHFCNVIDLLLPVDGAVCRGLDLLADLPGELLILADDIGYFVGVDREVLAAS